MHPLAYGAGRSEWRWEDMRDFYQRAPVRGRPLTAIGSSDYHWLQRPRPLRTLVFAEGTSAAHVLDALKKGRTVVYDREGHAYGDPALVQCLAADPYTPRPQDYGYGGSGRVDRIGRLVGWLGLVGCVLWLRRSRAAAAGGRGALG